MGNMVERVAKALSDANCAWFESETIAKAVIAAMREPTEAMIAAIHPSFGPDLTAEITRDWQKMIDAALSEK